MGFFDSFRKKEAQSERIEPSFSGEPQVEPSAPRIPSIAEPPPPTKASANVLERDAFLKGEIAQSLEDGEPADVIRARLLSRGLPAAIVDRLLAELYGNWRMGALGWTIQALGIAIALGGLFLLFGYLVGPFPAFPYAGTITTVIGALVFLAGRRRMFWVYRP